MPLNSMTGFGRAEASDATHTISVEIKSVNNRFLDFQCRGPRELMNLENVLRKELAPFVTRGSVSCTVNVETRGGEDAPADVALNEPLFQAYAAVARRMSVLMEQDAGIRASDLLRIPDMIVRGGEGAAKPDPAELESKILPVFREACAGLAAMRAREGEALARDLESRVRSFHPALEKVAALLPVRQEESVARLRARVAELLDGRAIAEDRLATEIGIMAEKLDVSEEMTRLRAHLDHFLEILADHPAPGKKLGFLQQEMLREVNTLSNKSQNFDIQQICIGLKEELENIREQVANVE